MLKYVFVDDDIIFLNILRAFFGSSPHHYCSDPSQVLPILQAQGPFDVLISDYDMPHENGLVLAEKVKALYPGLPIVMVSGHARPAHLPSFIDLWLSKPVDLAVLNQAVQACGCHREVCDMGFGAVEKT